MVDYRINFADLLDILSIWDGYLKRKVHLIACGGTAMTLLGLKESTKDIDFIVPVENEYIYLLKTIKDLGYKRATTYGWTKEGKYIFDLFLGKNIYTTELLESPMEEGNNIPIKEFSSIYLGVLNYYDWIISKIFRCESVDVEDCKVLYKSKYKDIDIEELKIRFNETAKYDISEEKCKRNLAYFLHNLEKEGFKI